MSFPVVASSFLGTSAIQNTSSVRSFSGTPNCRVWLSSSSASLYAAAGSIRIVPIPWSCKRVEREACRPPPVKDLYGLHATRRMASSCLVLTRTTHGACPSFSAKRVSCLTAKSKAFDDQGPDKASYGTLSSTAVGTSEEQGPAVRHKERQPGTIQVIIGPMFSGKTTELLKRMSKEKDQGRRVILVKSQVDKRYSVDEVVSHSGERMPCLAVASMADIPRLLGRATYEEVDVIGVDEAQFIKDLELFSRLAADHHGKTIILAGLDGDFMRRKFGALIDMIPLADSVIKLQAKCQVCGQGAMFTLRKSNDMRTEVIGGADLYMPVCRKHYLGAKSLVDSLVDNPTVERCDVVP